MMDSHAWLGATASAPMAGKSGKYTRSFHFLLILICAWQQQKKSYIHLVYKININNSNTYV